MKGLYVAFFRFSRGFFDEYGSRTMARNASSDLLVHAFVNTHSIFRRAAGAASSLLAGALRFRRFCAGVLGGGLHHAEATEQQRTIALMKEKGWENVRGGTYTQVSMRQPKWWREEEHVDVSTTKSINRMVATSELIRAFRHTPKSMKKIEGLYSEGPAAGDDLLVSSEDEDEGEYLSDD